MTRGTCRSGSRSSSTVSAGSASWRRADSPSTPAARWRRSASLPAPAEPLLFTYGTLMRGYGLHHVLGPRAERLGTATARGRLLDLGRYPGVVEGRGWVRGEVYRLRDPQVLAAVDRAEGVQFVR